MRTVRVSAPAALSSIFSPKVRGSRPEEIGARGGGFALSEGVETLIRVREGEGVKVFVNGGEMEFPPSITAARKVLERLGKRIGVEIHHRIKVPISTGFGTSAASALGVILGLTAALGNPTTIQEACRITHEVELECRTGLNSEAGFISGGLVLVLREGAPPRTLVDSIPLPSSAGIVAVVAGGLETPRVLGDEEGLRRVEEIGDRHLERILRSPSPERFLKEAREFAYESGLVTGRVEEMFEVFSRIRCVGYAQNMVGEAAHMLVEGGLEEVYREVLDYFPDYRVVASGLEQGVRMSLEPSPRTTL